jgi:hypothetical protein
MCGSKVFLTPVQHCQGEFYEVPHSSSSSRQQQQQAAAAATEGNGRCYQPAQL